jgi:peptide-methionine (S)-S-oxide reductase
MAPHMALATKEHGTMSATQIATFGAGCFWGVEITFRNVEGVVDAAVGYEGGQIPNPSYEQVCTGATGHAEVVQVEFDPAQVSFEQLLLVFFDSHDPTTKNRQGPDVGTQYRSAVFVRDDAQRRDAERVIAELDAAGRFHAPIVTTIEDASSFWRAEEYHQQYLVKNGRASCRI